MNVRRFCNAVTVVVNSAVLGALVKNAVFATERTVIRTKVLKMTWFESMTGKKTKSELLVHHNKEAV